MIDFQDTRKAFRLKSNDDLRRARFLFNSIGNSALVKYGSALALWSLKNSLPVEGLIRQTVFKQFVGGESIEACKPVIDKMHNLGVQSILDYSVEGKASEADFERTTEVTLQTIQFASKHSGVPLAVFKPTGLGRIEIWTKVSSNQTLSETEASEWERVQNRVLRICDLAASLGIPVMMDAEESWMQSAADDLALNMMRRFNRQQPVVYNTLQMYRHDRLAYLKQLLDISKTEGFHLGIKVVRGAYMEKERARALKHNYLSPIQANKSNTDRDYDLAVELLVKNIDHSALVAGTHNENSCRKMADLIESLKLDKNSPRLFFSQLYGMSDNLSFNLADAGYKVVKYLPFGPVKEVMPYLIRRAEENTSVGGQTGRELQLIETELRRRRS